MNTRKQIIQYLFSNFIIVRNFTHIHVKKKVAQLILFQMRSNSSSFWILPCSFLCGPGLRNCYEGYDSWSPTPSLLRNSDSRLCEFPEFITDKQDYGPSRNPDPLCQRLVRNDNGNYQGSTYDRVLSLYVLGFWAFVAFRCASAFIFSFLLFFLIIRLFSFCPLFIFFFILLRGCALRNIFLLHPSNFLYLKI